eukprot:CAMPEP_0182919362 /NCGR_PEP_ID=MMETSP0105_2-20130417/2660_1 /TAXON_ID=81532 ORGANISM="Acanthoeca-like sp., Strain 10tr" /NCGR_SAMPLE_ID=MMETSP0105_2 /ASSEMBLY_ACC=CAM_ASM_000205 /LENGTH=437 /DNA_ID=CAMNT_0025056529 /DNA_START=172 /DNA_END=1485 /DNA_ORIENTATION=-
MSIALMSGAVHASRPSRACAVGEPPITAGAVGYARMPVDHVMRNFVIKLPTSYRHDSPDPLVISIHGWRSCAEEQADDDLFGVLGDEEDFIAVWPEGRGDGPDAGEPGFPWNSWNGSGATTSPGVEGHTCVRKSGFCYESCRTQSGNCDNPCDWASCSNDLGYIEALLDYLERHFCIDLDMFYATGFSNGGIFSWQIGMSMANRFAAVSPGGGQPFIGFLEPPNLDGGHRISVMDVHGANDTVCPPYGGESHDDAEGLFWDCEGWLYTPVSTCTRTFAERHGCHGGETDFELIPPPWSEHVKCYQHGKCTADNAEFVRCVWIGTAATQYGGHFWPELPTRLDGSRLVWWFFKRHPFIHPVTPSLDSATSHVFYSTASDAEWITQDEYRREATRGLCPPSLPATLRNATAVERALFRRRRAVLARAEFATHLGVNEAH